MQCCHILRAHCEWRRRWSCLRRLDRLVVGALCWAKVALEVRHLGLIDIVETACATDFCSATIFVVLVDAMLHHELIADRTPANLSDLASVAVIDALGRRLDGSVPIT